MVYGDLYHASDPSYPSRGLQVLKPCQGPIFRVKAGVGVIIFSVKSFSIAELSLNAEF